MSLTVSHCPQSLQQVQLRPCVWLCCVSCSTPTHTIYLYTISALLRCSSSAWRDEQSEPEPQNCGDCLNPVRWTPTKNKTTAHCATTAMRQHSCAAWPRQQDDAPAASPLQRLDQSQPAIHLAVSWRSESSAMMLETMKPLCSLLILAELTVLTLR